MGYIQDKLKEALGGNRVMDSKNTVIRDWTPNNVRVLVISRAYILVIYHVGGFGGSRVVKLDGEQVALDLDKISRSGSSSKLNTILKRRSFSCMEELYVDSLFLESPSIIDLVSYSSDLLGSTSRLRYFGYGEFPLGSDEVIKSFINGNRRTLDYTLASDISSNFRLEYRGTGNNDWYKNYYLRPQYYGLDEENGKLALHFRKFESDYKCYLENKNKDMVEKAKNDMIRVVCLNDLNNINYMKRFDTLLQVITRRGTDRVCRALLGMCRESIRKDGSFEGLNPLLVGEILSGISDRDYLLKSYERYGVTDRSSKPINKDRLSSYLKEARGFIDLGGILDSICVKLIRNLVSDGYKDLVGMALMVSEKKIPNGSLRNTYIKKESSEGSLEGYFVLLGELIGEDL